MTPSLEAAAVTVIVPCYNEEAGLPSLIGRLAGMREAARDWQWLFVDDGSSDGTFGVLLMATRDHPWIEVVRHHENLGLGEALRTGFEEARAAIVCTIDSDCTYPPEKLPELVALVGAGADIATASAWHPESAAAEGTVLRLWLSRMVSSAYQRLMGRDVHTFTCLFRAYRADALRRIDFRSSGFAAVAEIMLRAILVGYAVQEVPMRLASRSFGESKLKVGDAIIAHGRLLVSTALRVGARRARERGGRMLAALSPARSRAVRRPRARPSSASSILRQPSQATSAARTT